MVQCIFEFLLYVFRVHLPVQFQREHWDIVLMEGMPRRKPKTKCFQMCVHKFGIVTVRVGLDPRACFPNSQHSNYGQLQSIRASYTLFPPVSNKLKGLFLHQLTIMNASCAIKLNQENNRICYLKLSLRCSKHNMGIKIS